MNFQEPKCIFFRAVVVLQYSHMTQVTTSWNVNAREFTPTGTPTPKLRSDAPVFVPIVGNTLKAEIKLVIDEAGIEGLEISNIPKKYFDKFNRAIDMSSCPYSDLSVLVSSIETVFVSEERGPARSVQEAMRLAGFNVQVDPIVEPEEAESNYLVQDDLCIGIDAAKIAKNVTYWYYIEGLASFKQSIIDVVYNFAQKNSGLEITGLRPQTATGLALSLFAAEWDRYHSVRLMGDSDLKILRERFGAAKLMPFLQSIPELDVVGTHPEVRVRVKAGLVLDHSVPSSPRSVLNVSKRGVNSSWYSASTPVDSSTFDGHSGGGGPRNISLNSELFGSIEDALSRPASTIASPPVSVPATPSSGLMAPEMQTRIVLEQMLSSTQSQILGILSKVPPDPLAAASAIEQMNQLQVLVNALKAALAVLPPVSTTSSAPKPELNIDDALFGSAPSSAKSNGSRRPLQLDTMLGLTSEFPPVSPLSSAAYAGTGVGTLLADLSRILFAQVIQQQQATPAATVVETNAALERTLADIVSAASSPACTPPTSPMKTLNSSSDPIVSGNLIIPNSLPTSPIPVAGHSAVITPPLGGDVSSSMDQLLRGLMAPPGLTAAGSTAASSPVVSLNDRRKKFGSPDVPVTTNLEKRMYGKDFMLSMRSRMAPEDLETPPRELQALACIQLFRAPRKTD